MPESSEHAFIINYLIYACATHWIPARGIQPTHCVEKCLLEQFGQLYL